MRNFAWEGRNARLSNLHNLKFGVIFHAFVSALFVLCSLLGTVLIITGLYTVLWGKAKYDTWERDGSDDSHCNIQIRQPLLQHNAANEHPST